MFPVSVKNMTKKVKRQKAYYSISAVAKMFTIHQQTVRLYEKEGLINPKRSEGNTRLFDEEDVNQLEEVIYLTHQLGINLAGVQMILKLQRQIQKMQKDMNKLFEDANAHLDEQATQAKQVVTESAKGLVRLKHRTQLPKPTETPTDPEEHDWDIEYEE